MSREREEKTETHCEEVRKIQNEVKEVKENLSRMNSMVTQIFEILMPNRDILVAGGNGDNLDQTPISTEMFSWKKNCWISVVSAMITGHYGAASFIYNNQLFVVGGDRCKKIEIMNLYEAPLKWIRDGAKLRYACGDLVMVVYKQRVFFIGGYFHNTRKRPDLSNKQSDLIWEFQPRSPFPMIDLCHMPEQRECHRAEVFEDKVFIIGGQKSINYIDALDSVLEFDLNKLMIKVMPRLPYPLTQMATVRWRDQVVVLGGRDRDGIVRNEVFMYDFNTGNVTNLPSMKEKRYRCCAVITGNTIVVMGGQNECDEFLSSVECLTMGCHPVWRNLPYMNESRSKAITEVLPFVSESNE